MARPSTSAAHVVTETKLLPQPEIAESSRSICASNRERGREVKMRRLREEEEEVMKIKKTQTNAERTTTKIKPTGTILFYGNGNYKTTSPT